MGIFQRLFSRKKDGKREGSENKGDNPGYLACPVVASELKRGRFDSDEGENPTGSDDASEDNGGLPPEKK